MNYLTIAEQEDLCSLDLMKACELQPKGICEL